jgi:hypothetical protein
MNFAKGSGWAKGSQMGSVEYYPWNPGAHICGGLPHTDVKFGVPSSETGGVGKATLGHAYEYGDCVGKVAFEMHRDGEGEVEVMIGFM